MTDNELVFCQKAKIESLEKKVETRNVTIADLKAENKRLLQKLQRPEDADPMDYCGVLCDFAEGLIIKTKAEAYKEFAKKLKTEVVKQSDLNYEKRSIKVCSELENVINKLDNLLKEMVGDGDV